MKAELARFVVPVSIGILIWILAFLLVGYTKMPGGPAELYLPMVALTGIIWTIMIFVVFRWYAKRWHIDREWLREAALFGITVAVLQFILDLFAFLNFLSYTPETFVSEYLLKSTVLVMYPVITLETIAVGYLLKRFNMI